MTTLVWEYEGLTTTCSENWLCLRSADHVLRARGHDEIADYFRVAGLLVRMFDCERPHRFTIRAKGHSYGFSFPERAPWLSIDGQAPRRLMVGDLMDQRAWFFPDRYPSGDPFINFVLDGDRLGMHGATPFYVTVGDRAALAGLFRKGAGIANGEALPAAICPHGTLTLTPCSGVSWTRLDYYDGRCTTYCRLSKSSLIRIAKLLEAGP